MYDVGIYFSDMAGKSVFFCRAGSGTTALVLLCEVEVGHTMLSYSQAYYNAGKSIKESGSCAVFAQGVTTHNQWCDAKCVHPDLKGIWMPDLSAGKTDKYASTALGHNEYVVYDPAQVRQRYLFQISIN